MESLRNDAPRVTSSGAPSTRPAVSDAGKTESSARPPAGFQSDDSKSASARKSIAFQIEAATWKLSAQFALIHSLNGGNGNSGRVANGVTGEPLTPEQIVEQTRAFVRDVFQKNGIEFDEKLTKEDAAAKVAPGGDQSPDIVAKRILDFVAAFANGDPARAQLLRDAVETGFGQAEGALGKKLPDISYQTMDLVRKGLDDLFKPVPPADTSKGSNPSTQGGSTSTPGSTPVGPKVIDSRV